MRPLKRNPVRPYARFDRVVLRVGVIFVALLMRTCLAWSQVKVIESVLVYIPGAPDGGSWDSALVDSIFSGNLRGIQPDIRVCVSSGHVPRTCTMRDCLDANWVQQGYVCQERLGHHGVLLENSLHVEVLEIDPGAQQNVATFNLVHPALCQDSQPCKVNTPSGPLTISFHMGQVSSYYGPYQGVSGTVGNPPSSPPNQSPSTATIPNSVLKKPTPSAGCIDNASKKKEIQPGPNPDLFGSLEGKPFIRGAKDACCIDSGDIQQGESGNCFLLSALATIAMVSPGTIKKSIVGLSPGSYAVTLYLPDETGALHPQSIAVEASFPKFPWYKSWGGGSSSLNPLKWYHPFPFAQPGDVESDLSELWVMLFEKAYAQTHGGYGMYAKGGDGGSAMQTVTGKPAMTYLVSPKRYGMNDAQWGVTVSTSAALDQLLSAWISQKRAVTAGTVPPCSQPSPSLWDQILSYLPGSAASGSMPSWVDACGVPTDDFRCTKGSDPFFLEGGGPLIHEHAYFLKDYHDGWITVGNPWGGSVTLNRDQFLYAFRQLQYTAPDVVADCSCN